MIFTTINIHIINIIHIWKLFSFFFIYIILFFYFSSFHVRLPQYPPDNPVLGIYNPSILPCPWLAYVGFQTQVCQPNSVRNTVCQTRAHCLLRFCGKLQYNVISFILKVPFPLLLDVCMHIYTSESSFTGNVVEPMLCCATPEKSISWPSEAKLCAESRSLRLRIIIRITRESEKYSNSLVLSTNGHLKICKQSFKRKSRVFIKIYSARDGALETSSVIAKQSCIKQEAMLSGGVYQRVFGGLCCADTPWDNRSLWESSPLQTNRKKMDRWSFSWKRNDSDFFSSLWARAAMPTTWLSDLSWLTKRVWRHSRDGSNAGNCTLRQAGGMTHNGNVD